MPFSANTSFNFRLSAWFIFFQSLWFTLRYAFIIALPHIYETKDAPSRFSEQSKKISNDQELIHSDPTSYP